MKQKLILGFALLLSALMPANAQIAASRAPAGASPAAEAERRRQSFEKVWSTINEKHFDPSFGGVDWNRVRTVYEPKALAAKTNEEFHAVLRRMLDELRLSHFSVYAAAPTPDQTAQKGGGITGIELKMIGKDAVISRVEKDSTAARANLKTGFIVKKIDGRTTAEILAPLEKSLSERETGEEVKNLYREMNLFAALGGAPETLAKIEVLNGGDAVQAFAVPRFAAKSEMSEAVGNFPPQEVVFEAKRLDGDIGYIRFNMWIIPQMPKIRQAVRDFAGAKGIIFDLRGNPGGIGGMAPGVAGLLMNERSSLGSMTGRETETKFIVYPQPDPFTGKIVILSDHGTASTSEVFAAGMQEIGRAKVIGERSAGAVLPSVFEILPTGAIFQYAISDYKSPKNVLIEGRGVVPDREIKQTRAALLEGRDLPLEEAVRQILQ